MVTKQIVRIARAGLLFVFAASAWALPAAFFASCAQKSEKPLVVAIGDNPDTLDPHRTSATLTAQITSSIYDTLVGPDFSPRLAERWVVSDDALTWTFFLRENVVFHNGARFTAQDVVATVGRIKNPATDSPARAQFDIIKSAAAQGEYIVQIQLAAPYSGLLALFADSRAAVLPAALIASNHNFNREPVGTGPFTFVSWEDNTAITLTRNDSYMLPPTEPKPVKSLVFLVVSDPASLMQALSRGEVDVAAYVVEPELSQLKSVQNVRIVDEQGSTILVLAMNLRREMLSDAPFRRAVAQAIDTKAVLDSAYDGGRYTPVFWAEGTPYSVSDAEYEAISGEKPVSFDLAAAKKFFTAYFAARGGQKKPLVITAPQAYPAHVRAAQVYQQQLAAAGLATEVEVVDWTTWLSRVYRGGEFDLTVIGHTGTLHPDRRLDGYGSDAKYVGWKNEAFLDLVRRAQTTRDEETARKLYKEAFVRLAVARPFVIVGAANITVVYSTRVKGVVHDPVLNVFDFRNASAE